MPRVGVDKQTGIDAATKKQWIMGACLGSSGFAWTLRWDVHTHFGFPPMNPAPFRILRIAFPRIQPMNYYRHVQNRDMQEAGRI
jgi:hypothetical protein